MNTDNSAGQYATRCLKDLGQQAHDSERVAIWCYDHPPRKPLPKTSGERNRQIWISEMLKDCLCEIADGIDGTSGTVDSIVNAALTLFVKENAPEIWELHERFQAERADLKRRLKELRRNEPGLEPDTIRSGSFEHDACGDK